MHIERAIGVGPGDREIAARCIGRAPRFSDDDQSAIQLHGDRIRGGIHPAEARRDLAAH